MPIFLSILFGVLASFVCMMSSYKYYAKYNFFLSLNEFLNDIKVNLTFLKNENDKVLSKNTKQSQGVSNLILWYKDFLSTKDEAGFCQKVENIRHINNEDKQTICKYFCMFGRNDCQTEKNINEKMLDYVNKRLDETKEEIHQKAVLIQKLSIILGIVVIILLI